LEKNHQIFKMRLDTVIVSVFICTRRPWKGQRWSLARLDLETILQKGKTGFFPQQLVSCAVRAAVVMLYKKLLLHVKKALRVSLHVIVL